MKNYTIPNWGSKKKRKPTKDKQEWPKIKRQQQQKGTEGWLGNLKKNLNVKLNKYHVNSIKKNTVKTEKTHNVL